MSAPARRRRMKNSDWEEQKCEIRRLYLEEDRQLKGPEGVIALMQSQHGFDASIPQYEAILKKWIFRKNLKKEEWYVVNTVVERRKRAGRACEVYLSGQRVSEDRLRKELHRHSYDPVLLLMQTEERLPEGVVIRPLAASSDTDRESTSREIASPDPSRVAMNSNLRNESTASDTEHQVMTLYSGDYLETRSPVPTDPHGSWLGTNGEAYQSQFSSANTTINPFEVNAGSDTTTWSIEPSGRSFGINNTLYGLEFSPGFFRIVEDIFGIHRFATMNPFESQLINDTLLRFGAQSYAIESKANETVLTSFIVFLLTNNFIGNDIPFQLASFIARHISHRTLSAIKQMWDNTKSPYKEALGQGLLRLALFAGSVPLVEHLITNGVQFERQYRHPETHELFGPLDFAISLNHVSLVQFLINYIGGNNGPIKDSLFKRSIPIALHVNPPSLDVFRILLEAGAVLHSPVYVSLMKSCFRIISEDERLTQTYLAYAHTRLYEHEKHLEILKEIAQWFDDSLVLKITYKTFGETPLSHSLGLEEFAAIAANRGLEMTLDYLLQFGWKPTINALTSAIESKSLRCIKLLMRTVSEGCTFDTLRLGGFANSSTNMFHAHSDPDFLFDFALPAAIRTGREDILCYIRSFCDLKTYKGHFGLALHAGIKVHNLTFVNELLGLMDSVSHPDIHLRFALEAAIQKRHVDIATRLLHLGVIPSSSNLETAISTRQTQLAYLILDFGIRVSTDFYALGAALAVDDRSILQVLFKNGFSINQTFTSRRHQLSWHHQLKKFCSTTGQKIFSLRCTPLSWAMLKNNRNLVDFLLSCGASFTAIDESYSDGEAYLSILAAAIMSGETSLVALALDGGADPCDSFALRAAQHVPQKNQILVLVAKAHEARYMEGRGCKGCYGRALNFAIQNNDLRMVELLAPHTIVNRIPSKDAASLFTDIILSKKIGILRILLECNVDPNSIVWLHDFEAPVTALLKAVDVGDLPIVEILCDYGADINRPAKFGIKRTPLQLAVEKGHRKIVQYLLDQSAEVNAAPALRQGATALQLAAIKGNMNLARLLLTHGANINAPGSLVDGRTAFEGAAEHGRLDMLYFLFENGVDIVSDGGEQYRRALKFAERNEQPGAKKMVEMLYQAAIARKNQSDMEERMGRESLPSPFL